MRHTLNVITVVTFAVCQFTSGYLISYPLPDPSDPSCVMINTTNFMFNFTYQAGNQTLSQIIPLTDIQTGGIANGDCGQDNPGINYVELVNVKTNPTITSVKFSFTHTGKSGNIRGMASMNIAVTFDPSKLVNSTQKENSTTATLKSAVSLSNVNYSYYCDKAQVLPMTNGVQAKMDVIQAQGFHIKQNQFSSSNGSVCPLGSVTTTHHPHKTTTPKTTHHMTTHTKKKTTTHHMTTTPSKKKTTTHHMTTPTKQKTTSHKMTTPTKEKTTSHKVTTPTKEKTTSHEVTTPTKEKTTSHEVTTPTKEKTTSHEVTTPTKEKTTSHEVTTPTKEKTTSHKITTPTKERTTTHGMTTPTKPKTTTHHMTTPTKKKTTTHSMSTTTSPPMVPNTFGVYEDGKTCLLLKAAMELHISYNDSGKMMNYTAVVPDNVTHSGMCNKDMEMLSIEWNNDRADVSMTLQFSKANKGDQLSASTDDTYDMSAVYVNYTIYHSHSMMVIGSISADGLSEFSTSMDDYYKCSDTTEVKLDEWNSLEMKDVQIQGFRSNDDNSTFSGTENNCKSSAPASTDTIVPIVVGAVLGVLVVVVLIGYCIGRRRANPTDYETL